MARFRIFPPESSPHHDQPGFISKVEADFLVATGRAYSLGNRSLRLKGSRVERPKPVDSVFLSAAGYDHAADRNPAKDFRDVYEMRSSGGIEMWQYTANRNARANT
jgi:hypothetical protein